MSQHNSQFINNIFGESVPISNNPIVPRRVTAIPAPPPLIRSPNVYSVLRDSQNTYFDDRSDNTSMWDILLAEYDESQSISQSATAEPQVAEPQSAAAESVAIDIYGESPRDSSYIDEVLGRPMLSCLDIWGTTQTVVIPVAEITDAQSGHYDDWWTHSQV